jgi:hypothetical protein
VIFFGGLEYDVRKQVADRYVSMDPAEENQDSGNIRLYTGKLSDRTYEFKKSLQVFLSFRNPREEFIAFFKKHCIDNPNVVMIGFRGDIRPLLRNQGISNPQSYMDESLRVNWYPNAAGRRLLLVSVDQNRIFASRSGALIEAISSRPPAIVFLGAAGAIDARGMVGKIVVLVSVMRLCFGGDNSQRDTSSRAKVRDALDECRRPYRTSAAALSALYVA